MAQAWVDAGAGLALVDAPAVVAAGDEGRVDFFLRALADVADPRLPGDPIEAEAPRVAQAHREDLVAAGDGAEERIGAGRRVRHARSGRRIDVEAQDLAEQQVEILRVVRRVVGAAAVADADVEIAVAPEGEHAAVVVGGAGMRNGQHRSLGGAGHVGVGRYPVLGNRERAVTATGVEHEEPAVGVVERVEGEPEQALLAARHETRAEVEENGRRGAARLQHLHQPAPLDDEQAVRVVAGMRDVERTRQTSRWHRHQANGGGRRGDRWRAEERAHKNSCYDP